MHKHSPVQSFGEQNFICGFKKSSKTSTLQVLKLLRNFKSGVQLVSDSMQHSKSSSSYFNATMLNDIENFLINGGVDFA